MRLDPLAWPTARHPFGEPAAIAEAVRRKVREVNGEIPVKFTTMEARLAQTVASARFRGILLGVFAGIAVLLAMAGIYGVMAYMVGQRTAEIGLRMALGAGRPSIVGMVWEAARGWRRGGWRSAFAARWRPRAGGIDALRVGATDMSTFVMMAAAVGLDRDCGFRHPGMARHAGRSAGSARQE